MGPKIQRRKIFITSCLALTVTGMAFSIRAEIITLWGADYQLSAEQLGYIVGTAFWGFTLAQFIEGPLIDLWGMKRFTIFAFGGHILGIVLTIFSANYWSLYIGTLLIGIGDGSIEATCNPLVTTLYPNNKSKKLNHFHSWYAIGIVIGALIAYYTIERLHIGWPWLMTVLVIPTLLYGYSFFTLKLPETERVSSGVSYMSMLKACANPLFIFLIFCMVLTAATEVGSQQWIKFLLGHLGISAILLLVLINSVIAIGRILAGPIIQRFSSPGTLLVSAVIAFGGLRWLSIASGYAALSAAFVFAAGVCYFWPTMLGMVSEFIPESGALGLNIIGGVGKLAIAISLPVIGYWYDMNKFHELQNHMDNASAQLMAGRDTLQIISYIPFILIFAFIFLFLRYRKGPDKKLSTDPIE